MALPASGLITLAMIAAEFGGAQPYSLSQFYRGGGRVTANNTGVPTSGLISLGQFYGASKLVVTPGSTNYGAGSRAVVIPPYNTLTIQIWGAGGGGGTNISTDWTGSANSGFGGTGGTSTFSYPGGTLVAAGGTGGGNALMNIQSGANGSAGSASGGTTNTPGGGNSGGAGWSNGFTKGGDGGRGGFVSRTWNYGEAGAPVVGASYTLSCGGGGAGQTSPDTYPTGGAGTAASATMTWS